MSQPYEVGDAVEYEPTGETVTVRKVQPVPPLHPADPPVFEYDVETAAGELLAGVWGSKLNDRAASEDAAL